ncbi:MAG: signal peptidase I [Euryarchaeota archaeon]|nr:signal peptidase I [Euryarchaeota archaeon]
MTKKRRKKKDRQFDKRREEGKKSSTIKELLSYLIIILVGIIAAQHMNVVVSGSMEPILYRGDIVVVEKTNLFSLQEINPNDIQNGDIIIYQATWFPQPVIHRVISTGKTSDGRTYFITKGDNNPTQDPLAVYPQQVIAKVITLGKNPVVIPKIGYITLWIRGL